MAKFSSASEIYQIFPTAHLCPDFVEKVAFGVSVCWLAYNHVSDITQGDNDTHTHTHTCQCHNNMLIRNWSPTILLHIFPKY